MNVLLSSVGRRSYLVDYFRAAVRGHGAVICTNSVANTPGMLAADVAKVVPLGSDIRFIDTMLQICREYDIGLLCSLHDWEAPYIAAAAQQFNEAGVALAVSSTDVIETCLDKFATFQYCQRYDILTPSTFLTADDALSAVARGEINFPLMVKPRHGQGSIGLHRVANASELRAALLLVDSSLKRSPTPLASGIHPAERVVIQEMINGTEYGLDIVNDFDCVNRACLAKRKLGLRAGETDAAVSVRDDKLEQLGQRIGQTLKHAGMLDADVICENGRLWLLELNPRFGGHYPFSHVAGANVPAALVAWASGGEAHADWLAVRPGVHSVKQLNLQVIRTGD